LIYSYGWYFTFVQGLVYLGLISLYGFKPKHIQNPWKIYIRLSAVLMGSHGLTKGSLMWLNYPAQIMFKSTKVGIFALSSRSCSRMVICWPRLIPFVYTEFETLVIVWMSTSCLLYNR
jgi:hypothetical protein